MKYIYSNLSPDDFEALCQDVISILTGSRFERFKPGKDGGIDLRLLEAEKQLKIVQVKHSPGSYGPSSKAMLQTEFNKATLRFVNGEQYLLMTSLGLSIANKKEIITISKGLIHSESDIFGVTEIEDILDKYPEIVKRHYKLWLSSAHVLTTLLNNGVYGKSDDYVERIRKRMQLFVQTKKVLEGQEILKNKHVLLITGAPGIGKTTLSEMLGLGYIGIGYDFIYADSVEEAESVFKKESKQLFFIDDFLGANYLEFIEGKRESMILRFIERVKSNNNKRLILSSRTTIFNNAIHRGIHFKDEIWNSFDCVLELSSYTYLDRAKLLYNHLRYRGLSDSYMDSVKNGRQYLTIVKHEHFNPRIIEFITTSERLEGIAIEKYIDFVNEALDNPASIWEQAYRNQINDEAKMLLQVIYSFEGQVKEEELKTAYNKRLKVEVECSGAILSDSPYNNSLKILLDGFITRGITKDIYGKKVTTIKFINPSVSDFIETYLKNNETPLTHISKSVTHLEQYTHLVNAKLSYEGKVGGVAIATVLNNLDQYQAYSTKNKYAAALKLMSVSQLLEPLELIVALFQGTIKGIMSQTEFSLAVNTISKFNGLSSDTINELFTDKFYVIQMLLLNSSSLSDLESVIDVAAIIGIDVIPMFENEFHEELECILDAEADELMRDDSDLNSCYASSDVRFRLNRLERIILERLMELGIKYNSGIDILANADDDQIANDNMSNSADSDDYVSSQSASYVTDYDIDSVFID